MVAIGILGTAIYKQQHTGWSVTGEETGPLAFVTQQGKAEATKEDATDLVVKTPSLEELSGNVKQLPKQIEKEDSPLTNIVKQYFAHIQAGDFKQACALMSAGKCAASRPSAVEVFSQEYQKYVNGYEYLSVRDFWIKSPSGKDIVCVKYAYRYKEDSNPALISEIMSYYIEEDVGKYVISDRVCEKKYKDGSGVRPCPIEARQDFCVGKIK